MPENFDYLLYVKVAGAVVGVLLLIKLVRSLMVSVKVSETLEKSFLNTFMRQLFQKPMLLNKANKHLKVGHFREAGELFEEAGLFPKAISAYEMGGEWYSLGKLFNQMKMKRKAAESFAKGGYPHEAVRVFKEIGGIREAARVLEENKQYEEAAELYNESGEFESAVRIYQNLGYFNYLGKVYEGRQMWVQAAEAYLAWFRHLNESRVSSLDLSKEVLKFITKASELYLKVGNVEKSVEILETEGIYDKAAKICEENALLDKAAELYELNHQYKEASQVYMKANREDRAYLMLADYHYEKGDNAEAAENYLKAGDFGRAAELYEWEREYEKAAEAYRKNENYAAAAENYLRVGQNEKAADLFSLSGKHSEAAAIYRETKKMLQAAQEYLKGGDPYNAGICFYDGNDYKNALEAFQNVLPDDANYHSALLFVSKIFFGNGKYDLVLSTLQTYLEGQKLNTETIGHFYMMARALQLSARYEEAIILYKQIQAVSFNYKDAKELLEQSYDALAKKKEIEIFSSDTHQRYRLIEKVGEGGMGVVYKAEDTVLKRIVALKILKETVVGGEKSVEKFYSEARLAAKMNHPNIITIYDVGKMDKGYFISMEFVEGENFLSLLKKRKRLSAQQILFVSLYLFKALEYAHKKGIIHRDIKLQNIMLTKDKQIKIMDFGLAILIKDTKVKEWSVAGTPTYMSPEQITGDVIDHRTDIYSSGITLYHLTAGFPPFRGEDVAHKHLHEIPVPLEEIRKDMPIGFGSFVLKCIEKAREKRFLSAGEALVHLKKLLSAPVAND